MTAPTRFATLVLDVGRPLPAVPLGGADFWAVVLTYDGRPIEHVWMPSPGAAEDPRDLLDALFGRAGARAAAEAQLRERLKARLGATPAPYPPLSCSVVVCTHGRPAFLDGLLRVPGAPELETERGRDRRQRARRRGLPRPRAGRRLPLRARDRRGLDNARRAGLARARDVVAFTDDDCLPARPGWRPCPSCSSTRASARSPGPGSRPSSRRRRRSASRRSTASPGPAHARVRPVHLDRGLRRAARGGANMVFRRDVLLALDDPFPAELDAGTPTRPGATYRARADARRRPPRRLRPAGARPPPPPARARSLHDTFRGYGVGMTSASSSCWSRTASSGARRLGWLVRQYLGRVADRARGRGDALDVRIGWNYLAGGLAAPAALVRARRAAGLRAVPRRRGHLPPRPHPPGSDRGPRAACPGSAAGPPDFSVVMPTPPAPGPLARLPARARRAGRPCFEVVVVDDDEPASATPERDAGVALRVVRTGGAGPGAARNAGARAARGGVLLFLDDDLVPGPGLLAASPATARRRRRPLVVGLSEPAADSGRAGGAGDGAVVAGTLRAQGAGRIALTFAESLPATCRSARTAFERVGGFDEAGHAPPRGLGVGLPGAGGRARRGLRAGGGRPPRVRRQRGAPSQRLPRGRRRRPARPQASGGRVVRPARPLAGRAIRRPLLGLFALGCRRSAVRSVAVPLLAVLKRVRARRWWARLYGFVIAGAWHDGVAQHAGPRPPR